MKSNILKLVLILIILPLQSHASSMTEKEFIQSMFDYTNQQNNLTRQIAIQAKNKNIAQGAKLNCASAFPLVAASNKSLNGED